MHKVFFVTVLILLCSDLQCLETYPKTLESALELSKDRTNDKTSQHVLLDDGVYTTYGIDATHKQFSLQGSALTEIVMEETGQTKQTIFSGKTTHISLQKLRFAVSDVHYVSIVENESIVLFQDSTLIGTTMIRNCFEVNGGELVLANLNFEFQETNNRIASNIIQFGKFGGYLHVIGTSIERMAISGGTSLFGDKDATKISFTNCKFNQLFVVHSDIPNTDNSIIGQTNIHIEGCTFTDVENALIGCIVNGMNGNGNLQVINSSFKNCINMKYSSDKAQNNDRESVISGDAEYKDVVFEDIISQEFGGAINFISNGKLHIEDCEFKRCISNSGKGGGIYVVGSGEHIIKGSIFQGCISNHTEVAEGGSLYLEGGKNHLSDLQISASKAQVIVSVDGSSSQSISKGGGILIRDWSKESLIKDIIINECQAGSGGAIYIDSVSDRLNVRDSSFMSNLAYSNEGGGAIFVKDTTLIHIKDSSFENNKAMDNIKGSDLQFGNIGIKGEEVNFMQIRKDTIEECYSNSIEPRVCINEYGCQYGWIIDESSLYYEDLSTWAILMIVFIGVGFSILVVVMCCCCCCKLILHSISPNKEKHQSNENKNQQMRSIEEGSMVINPINANQHSNQGNGQPVVIIVQKQSDISNLHQQSNIPVQQQIPPQYQQQQQLQQPYILPQPIQLQQLQHQQPSAPPLPASDTFTPYPILPPQQPSNPQNIDYGYGRQPQLIYHKDD
ncbi:MAG: hypothetical protein EZS28_003546 [Streblomastix strix]|uniref:Right handed beta helix domain-containing protein n=1 Tax=Streblomastix strix TaxID=222440 RepID=A0A5J4X0Y7_9EUKA|nr:MAG: hypothetical protein EZS28_003546 [Streblomastix strix]